MMFVPSVTGTSGTAFQSVVKTKFVTTTLFVFVTELVVTVTKFVLRTGESKLVTVSRPSRGGAVCDSNGAPNGCQKTCTLVPDRAAYSGGNIVFSTIFATMASFVPSR